MANVVVVGTGIAGLIAALEKQLYLRKSRAMTILGHATDKE